MTLTSGPRPPSASPLPWLPTRPWLTNPTMLDLAEVLVRQLDPARLMLDLGFAPDPWQARALRTQAKRVQMLCCRQSGKSTTTAVKALHTALYEPDSLVVLVSP